MNKAVKNKSQILVFNFNKKYKRTGKKKETIEQFEMVISGERAVGKEPALWQTINIVFKFKGSMSKEQAEKACALSMDKYCSVAATLRAAGAKITWDVEII